MLATWESVQVDLLSKSKTHRGQCIRVVFLLALFLLPLLSIWPLSEASAERSLPACCRTHGKHHCSAIRSGISISNDENAPIARTQIVERCPFQGGYTRCSSDRYFRLCLHTSSQSIFPEKTYESVPTEQHCFFQNKSAHIRNAGLLSPAISHAKLSNGTLRYSRSQTLEKT